MHVSKTNLDYPENLLDEIGIEYLAPMLDELEKNLQDVIQNTLKEREAKVIISRYKEGLTLREIAKQFSLGTERIRQIEAKALRKLRHPSRRNIVLFGYGNILKLLNEIKDLDTIKKRVADEKKAAHEQICFYRAKVSEACSKIDALQRVIYGSTEQKDLEAVKEGIKEFSDWNTSIDELNFSVRAYNCCKRAGFNKVSDFAGKTMIEMQLVRNLGKKSLDEVIQKLKPYGIIFQKD